MAGFHLRCWQPTCAATIASNPCSWCCGHGGVARHLLGPTVELLPMLAEFSNTAARPLHLELVARRSLAKADWAQVPTPCSPLAAAALPAVLARSPAEAPGCGPARAAAPYCAVPGACAQGAVSPAGGADAAPGGQCCQHAGALKLHAILCPAACSCSVLPVQVECALNKSVKSRLSVCSSVIMSKLGRGQKEVGVRCSTQHQISEC